MNKWVLLTIAVAIAVCVLIPDAALAKGNRFSDEEVAAEKSKDSPYWIEGLRVQHRLSDEHIQFMKGHGLTYPQMAIASRLSEKSGKTVDDILEMRAQKKMDWEMIAKELEIDFEEGLSSIVSIRQDIDNGILAEIKNARND